MTAARFAASPTVIVDRHTIDTYGALDNTALALGDELPPVYAGSVCRLVTDLSWTLTGAQRTALAAVLEEIRDGLRAA